MKKLFETIKQWLTIRFKHGEKIDIVYPVSWEGMSQEDFKSVCSILGQPHGEKETLFLCLCSLAHIRPDNPIKYDPKALGSNLVFIIGDKSYTISPTVIQEACDQLSYITRSYGLAPSPLPKIDRKLYGISFGQFYEADALMLRYADTNDERWLKEAAKVLTKGAIRKLLPWQKKGLVIWWNGVKMYLKQKYSSIFQEGGTDTYVDKTPADILQELLGTMNGNKPQDNEKILKSDVHSVLYSLNQIYYKNAHK